MHKTVEEILQENGWNKEDIDKILFQLYEGTITDKELELLQYLGAIKIEKNNYKKLENLFSLMFYPSLSYPRSKKPWVFFYLPLLISTIHETSLSMQK